MRSVLFVLLFILSFFPSIVSAFEGSKLEQEPVDTIILISGRKMTAHVQRVATSRISYIEPGSDELKEMNRRQVHRIIYKTGRIETFNTLAAEVVAEGDWRTIILTDDKSDVEGLYDLGSIEAQSSPRSRDARSAERSANIRLQKRAANMGGFMVYITRRESMGGFGEVPTHYVEGIVYGFEPPPE